MTFSALVIIIAARTYIWYKYKGGGAAAKSEREIFMKKLLVPMMLTVCLLLSSCGADRASDSFESFTEKLRACESLSFDAALRAEYDDKTAEFTVKYVSDSGGCTVTVMKPELISGISARVENGESRLQFNGMALGTGELTSFGLSPMSALPMLIDGIKSGYAGSVWEENGEIAAAVEASDELSIQIHIDKYTLAPLCAELISGGEVKVFADIYNWNIS